MHKETVHTLSVVTSILVLILVAGGICWQNEVGASAREWEMPVRSAGVQAAVEGFAADTCPYADGPERDVWMSGYYVGRKTNLPPFDQAQKK